MKIKALFQQDQRWEQLLEGEREQRQRKNREEETLLSQTGQGQVQKGGLWQCIYAPQKFRKIKESPSHCKEERMRQENT